MSFIMELRSQNGYYLDASFEDLKGVFVHFNHVENKITWLVHDERGIGA